MSAKTQPNTNYCLQTDESLPDGIKRIAIEMADRAIWQLTHGPHNDKAVHDARKCCKKIRAVLRLVRDEIGQDVYRSENALYRDAARELSDLRSSAVMAETLDALCERFTDDLPPDAYTNVRQGLMDKHYRVLQDAVESGNLFLHIGEILDTGRERLLHLPLKTEDFSTLHQGLCRVYRRGGHAMAVSSEGPSTENLHEWRKRVKYLRYQMRVLNPLEPVIVHALAKDLDKLSDLLGLDHDLAELRVIMEKTPFLASSKKELRTLLAGIDLHRLELQADAFELGGRLYAESPRAFVDRLEGYWEVMAG